MPELLRYAYGDVVTTRDPYQPGAIVADSWGYDQTNIDFYRIVKRKGDWLTLQPLESVEVSDDEPAKGRQATMTGTATHGPATAARPFRRRMCFGTEEWQNGQPIGFAVRNYASGGWARIWNGQPEHVSHYA